MQYSYGSGRNNAGKPIVAYSSIDDYPVFGHFDNVYEYHRSILSDKEKILYDEIVESYLQFKPDLSTSLNSLTTEENTKLKNQLKNGLWGKLTILTKTLVEVY